MKSGKPRAFADGTVIVIGGAGGGSAGGRISGPAQPHVRRKSMRRGEDP